MHQPIAYSNQFPYLKQCKFSGVTNSTPLKRNLVLRFRKGSNHERDRIKILITLFICNSNPNLHSTHAPWAQLMNKNFTNKIIVHD